MIEEIKFEIPREHREYSFTIESDEQFVYLDPTLRHPDFMPQNPMQNMGLIISRQDYFEDLNNFLKKVIISNRVIDPEFIQSVLVDICKEHINKFGRLWYNDLIIYTDLYIAIEKAIFKHSLQQSQNLYRLSIYKVLNKFPTKILFPSPMGGHYSWADV